MTLNETVLQKLADWSGPRDGRQILAVADEGSGWAVNLTADRHDDLSCALWEMSLQRTRLPAAGDSLSAWAGRVAERVSGLLEALSVLEVDTQRDEALLRSSPPSQRGNELYYYEVRLRGLTQAMVRRYHASHNKGRREQVAFALTHEALAKFATDLAAD
jgi:hypothetical protein